MRSLTSPSVARRHLLGTAAVLVLASCVSVRSGHCSEDDDAVAGRSPRCPGAFFNFGDSLSDTGNAEVAMPGVLGAGSLPYGEAFFQTPTGRNSNGRLVIDFMLMAFKLPLLRPHLLPSHKNDRQGLNFAYAGATAERDVAVIPYPLPYQVEQFIELKNEALQTHREQTSAQDLNEFDEAKYSTALYTLCVGGNDLMLAIFGGAQPKAIVQDIVPTVLYEIVSAIEALYFQGARNFMLFNGPPLGCATVVLTLLDGSGLPVDDLGCIRAINEINNALNSQLLKSVERLRAALPNVTIIYFDYYAANIEIVSNPSRYGFNSDVVQTACCGAPGLGTLNYNFAAMCGFKNFQKCDNPDEYLVWDGIHWTEAFYRHIAMFVLNGKYSDPPTNLTKACDLTFEDFGHTTYEEVYSGSISSSFDEWPRQGLVYN